MSTILDVSRLHQRLERQHRRLLKDLENGPMAWIIPRFASGSILGIGLTLVLPGFLGGGLGLVDLSSWGFWVRLLGPVFVAGMVTPYMYFNARKQSQRTLDEVVRRSEGEFALLTAPGWVRRVFRRGTLLALGIGLPVGALLAFGSPVTELPAGSRLLAMAGFLAATAAWTLPGAFALRWLSLKSYGVRTMQTPPER